MMNAECGVRNGGQDGPRLQPLLAVSGDYGCGWGAFALLVLEIGAGNLFGLNWFKSARLPLHCCPAAIREVSLGISAGCRTATEWTRAMYRRTSSANVSSDSFLANCSRMNASDAPVIYCLMCTDRRRRHRF